MTLQNIILVINIFFLEAMLSLDNAAALSILASRLPKYQQAKALKYGIIGAFLFRGIFLVLAVWIVKIMWLKILGGLYLIYLVYKQYKSEKEEDEVSSPSFLNRAKKYIGDFWATVIVIEMMDIAFSLDNVFAAASMTDNIYLILFGVCSGIIAMRFVAQWFTILIKKYPSLEHSAFVVIFLLGLKLMISGILHYIPCLEAGGELLSDHEFDLYFSLAMMLIFAFPIIIKIWQKK